jgi:phosphoserine phosphatase
MSTPAAPRTALVYDFDGTLAPGNIQEHSLIPNHLGIDVAAFWAEVGAQKQQHDADEILIYMRLLLAHAERAGVRITRDILREHGARTPLFRGVASWFERIDRHARARGLELEHYVVSSGNREMIEGSSICQFFTRVFASSYIYDDQGDAVWPAVVVNYTTKTQHLFRINKGVKSNWDNASVNRWVPMQERPVPFERIIYLGDGDTDIPSMKVVRHQGGCSIAVFDPDKWQRLEAQSKVYDLISEDRAHFVVPADYTEGGQLDITIKGVLGRIAREAGFRA